MSVAITLANGDSINTPKWHKKRYALLQADRQPFLNDWDAQQRYILPRLNRMFFGRTTQGKPAVFDEIINTTPTQAVTTTANGMMAGITSPARRWQKLASRVMQPGGERPGEHSEWLQYADDWLFRFWDRTDLYAMLKGIYDELLVFNTAAGFGAAVPGAEATGGFVWKQLLAGNYVIGEDANGMVDTIYREVVLTVEQLVSKYVKRGKDGTPIWSDSVSDRTRRAWENGKWEERVTLLQVFGPSPFIERYLKPGAPQWYETVFEMERSPHDDKPGSFLAQNPYEVYPAFCVRWAHTGNTPWGTGPGAEALPDARQLQEMEEKLAVALSKHIDPPLMGPPDLEGSRVSGLPGDVTYVPGANTMGLSPMYEVKPSIADFREGMNQVELRIRRSFYSDLFAVFLDHNRGPEFTEDEVWERKEEKLLGLGGVMDRLDRELIRPVTNISLDYGLRTGELEAPPEGLEEVDIEYLNVIAVAQRTQGLTAISDTVSFISTVAEKQVAAGLQPSAWDRLDVDATIDKFAEKRGTDLGILRDEEDTEDMREQRAEAQAQQAQLEAEAQAASAAKDMAAAEELAARTQTDQGPAATGAGPGALPPDVGAQAP